MSSPDAEEIACRDFDWSPYLKYEEYDRNTYVVTLSLAQSEVDDRALDSFSAWMWNQLISRSEVSEVFFFDLMLQGNLVTSGGLEAITKVFLGFSDKMKLLRLDASNNQIDDAAIGSITSLIETQETPVEKIVLSGNRIGNFGLACLLERILEAQDPNRSPVYPGQDSERHKGAHIEEVPLLLEVEENPLEISEVLSTYFQEESWSLCFCSLDREEMQVDSFKNGGGISSRTSETQTDGDMERAPGISLALLAEVRLPSVAHSAKEGREGHFSGEEQSERQEVEEGKSNQDSEGGGEVGETTAQSLKTPSACAVRVLAPPSKPISNIHSGFSPIIHIPENFREEGEKGNIRQQLASTHTNGSRGHGKRGPGRPPRSSLWSGGTSPTASERTGLWSPLSTARETHTHRDDLLLSEAFLSQAVHIGLRSAVPSFQIPLFSLNGSAAHSDLQQSMPEKTSQADAMCLSGVPNANAEAGKGGAVPRRRGRPRGSKNKPKGGHQGARSTGLSSSFGDLSHSLDMNLRRRDGGVTADGGIMQLEVMRGRGRGGGRGSRGGGMGRGRGRGRGGKAAQQQQEDPHLLLSTAHPNPTTVFVPSFSCPPAKPRHSGQKQHNVQARIGPPSAQSVQSTPIMNSNPPGRVPSASSTTQFSFPFGNGGSVKDVGFVRIQLLPPREGASTSTSAAASDDDSGESPHQQTKGSSLGRNPEEVQDEGGMRRRISCDTDEHTKPQRCQKEQGNNEEGVSASGRIGVSPSDASQRSSFWSMTKGAGGVSTATPEAHPKRERAAPQGGTTAEDRKSPKSMRGGEGPSSVQDGRCLIDAGR
uniref:Uncharacterized protein n=1 Tax=Chromera velia CCMP2878 TaxID=1169474 RepID=A0A0G4H8S6_9ALVE|eukprot:Cvel_25119.t1-p1 / transcript=Cvel_25119.t1 / gene=Cvel_25119 / organism=Chromera_velia_CCMP2878 / gene_product=hypothetical protein / transcript_product=hypothetical protein / location=Cvel_scaffold2804:1379-6923(+) / protein_length=820 / sequence_SO=supercontig / SO=protein_coding / is_pseudo=false